MNRDRVLTGIRSNGELHIGNYLGAMLPMVEIQKAHGKTHDMFFFVPDLHSFTTPINHDTLFEHSVRNLKYFVAAGMDFWAPGARIYRQSYVSAHSELTWILDCFTYFGEANRMTQFKDKAGLGKIEREEETLIRDFQRKFSSTVLGREPKLNESFGLSTSEMLNKHPSLMQDSLEFVIELLNLRNRKEESSSSTSVGLFNYPILMAADILLYNARYVPLGDDQKQHLELARDLGQRMNNKFSEVFPDGIFTQVPEDWKAQLAFAQRDNGVRIRSLRNPEKKMSKSVEDPAGTIAMTDAPTEAAKKVMSATTDSLGNIHFDWERQPGVSNLIQILALMSERPIAEVASDWDGKTRYGDLKKAVAATVESFLTDFQAKVTAVDENRLLQKLEEDEKAVNEIAAATLLRAQQAVGLRPRS